MILKDYGRHFMELRRAPYEAYLIGKVTAPIPDPTRLGGEPWPYNLVAKVGGEPSVEGFVLTKDHEDGIMYALDTLPEREKSFILLYYRDGMTFGGIGKQFNATNSYAREVVAQGMRRLRNPMRKGFILYGYQYTLEHNELARRRNEAEMEAARLSAWEADLAKRREALVESEDDLARVTGNPVNRDFSYAEIPLSDLNLSTRAENGLSRAGCKTLADVVELARSGKLREVRRLGQKSTAEIVRKVLGTHRRKLLSGVRHPAGRLILVQHPMLCPGRKRSHDSRPFFLVLICSDFAQLSL